MGGSQNDATTILDAGNITDLAQEQSFVTKGIDRSNEFMNPLEVVKEAINKVYGNALNDIQSNVDFDKNINTGAQEYKFGSGFTNPENFKGGITQSR